MKDIPGFEKLYAATKDGSIWAYPKPNSNGKGRWKEGRFLKPWLQNNGYKVVMLYREVDKPVSYLVHRLIALTYISNQHNFPEVNHKDANIINNKSFNLEWVTSKQNKKHAWNLGLYERNRGEKHYLVTLTLKQVLQIRLLCDSKKLSQEMIAKQFNVCPMTISNIKRRVTWKHVV